MKNKYTLDCYDQIISLIRAPRLFAENQIIDYLQQTSSQSFQIQPLTIKKTKTEYKLSPGQPIHNLHPDAPAIDTLPQIPIEDLAKPIGETINQLHAGTETIYQASANLIYIIYDVELQSLEQSTLLFIYCYQYLKQSNAEIKRKIKSKIFKLDSKSRIEHYIHKQQFAADSLANHLIELINPKTTDDLYKYSDTPTAGDCLKITYRCVEDLVRYLESEYAQYLNINMTILCRAALLTKHDVQHKIKFIKSCIVTSGINESLARIAFEPLTRIESSNLKDKLTYKEFNYCLELIKELHQNFSINISLTDAKLCKWLFNFNFNALSFFEYKTDLIEQQLQSAESIHSKLTLLYKIRKDFSQRQSRSINIYDDRFPPIKQQIIFWLDEEIEYQTTKLNLEAPAAPRPEHEPKKEKILSGISVAQLSYTFNLLAQVGIINQRNQRDIFRFIADNFKTNIADQISVDSIKSKYYNVESATKEAVRQKVIEILNITKK
ncbi:MAG: hypothetical protein EOO51_08340 [Flavobacterium sp.]|nr:MAG: hypothetical protein EOO51_08340 [Flavobacterium sp.]